MRNTRGREGYLPEDCVDICWLVIGLVLTCNNCTRGDICLPTGVGYLCASSLLTIFTFFIPVNWVDMLIIIQLHSKLCWQMLTFVHIVFIIILDYIFTSGFAYPVLYVGLNFSCQSYKRHQKHILKKFNSIFTIICSFNIMVNGPVTYLLCKNRTFVTIFWSQKN